MNILAEAAITAVVGRFVSDAIAKKNATKADTIVDPIPKASPTNAQPMQPIATSVRDTEKLAPHNMVAWPPKTPWISHLGNKRQYGDPVPGTVQVISVPAGKLPTGPGKVSTTIFAQQTDPADAGNVSTANRVGTFYLDPITGARIPTSVGMYKLAGTSGGVYMLMSEHIGTPAETINDPQTAHVQASLIPGSPTLAPGVQPKVLPLNPTQKIPSGAKWAALSYA